MLVHTNGLTGNNEKTNKKKIGMCIHTKKKCYIGRSLELRSKN